MDAASSESWFDRVLEQQLDALYRYALQLCNGRQADGEDLVHDAVLRALRAQHQLREAEAARGWLYRIVWTTHLNRVRSHNRRAESTACDLDEGRFEEALAAWNPVTGIEEELLRALDWDRLQGLLDQLHPELRATLWLSDVEGFGQKEIAAMLEVPEGTVASRIYRARRALRARLAETAETTRAVETR